MNTAERNLVWADRFVAALAAAGLRHVVLAPGARSAPLALAVLRRPEIECHVVSDERAAGYFALGIGKATGQPAAVLCTSGTAAANLLPAIMEANLAAVPLLALTADRPAEAIGWGTNQTADQTQLYGVQVRACHAIPVPTDEVPAAYLRILATRLLEECMSPLPGPVHANLPFREPLLPDATPAPPPLPEPIAIAGSALPCDASVLVSKLSGKRGVILCGEGRYPAGFATAITQIAKRLGTPILAEPLSNLRCGSHDKSHILAHQARFLRQANLPTPDWVLRFGSFPVSRSAERWLAGLTKAHHVLVAAPDHWPDPLWQTNTLVRGVGLAGVETLPATLTAAPAEWLALWHEVEAAAARQASQLCTTDPLFEGTVVRALISALPAGAQLFVGNSLAIRAIDAFFGTSDKPLVLHGNRGTSGIDGNFATAAGIAAATAAPTVVLVGDQAALHDANSLELLARHDVVAVVMDNGGGGIFDHLPLARSMPGDIFSRGWTAPQQVEFPDLASAYGLRHAAASDTASLQAALHTACTSGGAWLLQVVIHRAQSQASFAA